MKQTPADWYKHAVIYQIYPRSFADGNADGVGDLIGIISKLDYLHDLGVDALWLSPIYRSPMADFGYDVSDYQAIDPIFGSLADFDQLVEAAHARHIKILMDFVPNHTSNEHPWFLESASSLDNPKRDWYIWKDAAVDGSLPNNWQSVFGGAAWTLDGTTNQYYLHSFLSEQPDLNWANPAVQQAIQDTMRFWYGRGVDGFRVDAILFTSKDLEFRDNPEAVTDGNSFTDSEHDKAFSHGVIEHLPAYIKVLSEVTKEYPGNCLFLEAYPDQGDPAGYLRLYDFIEHEVTAPFYFGIFGATYDWRPETVRYLVDSFQTHLPADAFAAYVLGNHDTSRLASRIGAHNARAIATLQLTLPGTKFIYYGEELGLLDVDISYEQRKDPSNVSRDAERTPMRWNSGPNAGFSTVEPWLPIGDDIHMRNVQSMEEDTRSILALYRQLIALRQLHPALKNGNFESLSINNPGVYGFKRVSPEEQILILINFLHEDTEVSLPIGNGVVLLSSTLAHVGGQGSLARFKLNASEAVIIATDQ